MKCYCLTCLRFSLNIVTSNNQVQFSKKELIWKATPAKYLWVWRCSIYDNHKRISAEIWADELRSRLPANTGVRVLGPVISGEHGSHLWQRGSDLADIIQIITWRCVFCIYGELIGHFPVCEWICIKNELYQMPCHHCLTRLGWKKQMFP